MDKKHIRLGKSLILIFIFTMISGEKLHAQNADFMYMIEQAIKAPSGHNSQPWLFQIKENEIEILPNARYRLEKVDPQDREMFISLGCATENLCIAATTRGYSSKVTTTEEGKITVYLEKSESIKPDSLAAQIPIRQTTRRKYNGEIIDSTIFRKIANVPCEPDIHVHFFKRGSSDFQKIAQYVYMGNNIQMKDSTFLNELKEWMRYNKKEQDKKNDGLSYAAFGAPNLPHFIAKAIMSKMINAKTQNKTDYRNINSSSHLVLFTATHNTPKEWIALGRTLERFLLLLTSHNIRSAYLNQPNEVKQLSASMAEGLGLQNEVPNILLRIGYGKLLPYSQRRDISTFIYKAK